MVLADATILLYFIMLNNSYCAETSNTVLDHVIVVHFCVGFTFWFLKMWLFPYPCGFFNPVWIYGRKISDMIRCDIWYDIAGEEFAVSASTSIYVSVHLRAICENVQPLVWRVPSVHCFQSQVPKCVCSYFSLYCVLLQV
jgi:hypothetical protein